MVDIVEECNKSRGLVMRVGCSGFLQKKINPICILCRLEPFELLAFTEWQDAAPMPQFASVLQLPEHFKQFGTLLLQFRHVNNSFWDAHADGATASILAMPLLGSCTFAWEDAASAPDSGLLLPIVLDGEPWQSSGMERSKLHATVRISVPIAGEPWSQAISCKLQRSVAHFCFFGGPLCQRTRPLRTNLVPFGTQPNPASTHRTPSFAASIPTNPDHGEEELHVTEHLFSCRVAYEVPLAVLRALCAEARQLAVLQPGSSQRKETDFCDLAGTKVCMDIHRTHATMNVLNKHDEDAGHNCILARLSPSSWASLASWGEQILAQLTGAFQHEHGFKASPLKASSALSAMPVNLQLNVLDIVESHTVGGNEPCRASPGLPSSQTPPSRAIYSTVSLGAFAAHSLGFQDGGATELERQLSSRIRHCAPSALPLHNGHEVASALSVEPLALAYAQRHTILSCQACAALTASFIASCQERAGAGDVDWFAQISSIGYLVQAESLLTTRGEEWGMLEDVRVACCLLSRVRLIILEDEEGQLERQGQQQTMADDAPAASTSTGNFECYESRGQDDDELSWQRVGKGVHVRGGHLGLILEFSPRDLGFRDAAHAASMGLRAGTVLGVYCSLFNQGIDAEQSIASAMRMHTAEQQALNETAECGMRSYCERCIGYLREIEAARSEGAVTERTNSRGMKQGESCSLPTSFIHSALPTHAAFQASLRLPHDQRLAAERKAAVVFKADDPLAHHSVPPPCAHGLTHLLGAAVHPFRYPTGGTPPKPQLKPVCLLARLRALQYELAKLVREPPEGKNVMLLGVAAELTRLLGGGRLTMCKSGKDRTAMSITLEHGRLLHGQHGLNAQVAAEAVQTMRRRGVRRENVRFNTSRRLYAFNWLQQMALPEPFRPPAGSAKSGKA